MSLISIDPTTAAATEIIRRSGVVNPAFELGVAFDDNDDLILGGRQTTLWSLDTATGAPTFISLTVEAYGATSNIFGSNGPGPTPTPEPGTLSLLGLAIALGGLKRRRT